MLRSPTYAPTPGQTRNSRRDDAAEAARGPDLHASSAGVCASHLQALMAGGGNLAMVQLSGGGRGASVRDAASAGVRGGGGALPHGAAIQASFGRHDVSGIGAHVGGDAAAACRTIGAEAYATGDQVAFRGAPDLHTAAHEAAHVVQQRGGVQLLGGVGRAGDRYEQHADAVADRVVQGLSAEGLLDRFAGGGGGAAAVQRFERPEEEGGDVAPHEPAAQERGEAGADPRSRCHAMFTAPPHSAEGRTQEEEMYECLDGLEAEDDRRDRRGPAGAPVVGAARESMATPDNGGGAQVDVSVPRGPMGLTLRMGSNGVEARANLKEKVPIPPVVLAPGLFFEPTVSVEASASGSVNPNGVFTATLGGRVDVVLALAGGVPRVGKVYGGVRGRLDFPQLRVTYDARNREWGFGPFEMQFKAALVVGVELSLSQIFGPLPAEWGSAGGLKAEWTPGGEYELLAVGYGRPGGAWRARPGNDVDLILERLDALKSWLLDGINGHSAISGEASRSRADRNGTRYDPRPQGRGPAY